MLRLPSFESWGTFTDVSILRTRHLTLLNLRVREPRVTRVLGVQNSLLLAAFTSILPLYFCLLGETGNYAQRTGKSSSFPSNRNASFEFSDGNKWISLSSLSVVKQKSTTLLQNFSLCSLLWGVFFITCVKSVTKVHVYRM
jgi:hypothetical protein